MVARLSSQRHSTSLERGLLVLSCFTATRSVLGIAEIAEELGMGRSTTHRYVSTLCSLGYLRRAASRKYRLDIRVAGWGAAALNSTGLRHARGYIELLARRTSSTVSLVVLDGAGVAYIDQLSGARHYAKPNDTRVGSRWPVYCTAAGKLLLAYLPVAGQRALIAAIELEAHAPNTIVRKGLLRTELARIHDQHFSMDREESATGFRAIAAPIREETGEVIAAVEIEMSKAIASDELPDLLLPHLRSTADQISARLGYRHAEEHADPPSGS